ncbi:hypothetical protein BCR41DRAFT_237259 [Lobosporangium transversale]|uniref:Uncharacterized protein n=1 Tax=Lobosporangium transversale TaxID=64571 RepID=A0A1Y2GV29_9FUNG|nr:hypothetical protein BCR41DRAFT_237259 [Lobosporangium transversale]ORZ24950.1 hypothetical protein BCR41DRAFT_237259 [Lobosporangium transversale]|eukprot:XP_021883931.1 hypothetical protein BCR41DRAFT_237259 [Lobosporangium transversale]
MCMTLFLGFLCPDVTPWQPRQAPSSKLIRIVQKWMITITNSLKSRQKQHNIKKFGNSAQPHFIPGIHLGRVNSRLLSGEIKIGFYNKKKKGKRKTFRKSNKCHQQLQRSILQNTHIHRPIERQLGLGISVCVCRWAKYVIIKERFKETEEILQSVTRRN